MQVKRSDIETLVSGCLGEAPGAGDIGWACAWLEACGYPGLKILEEALADTPVEARSPVLEPDILGLDLNDISCVFIAPTVTAIAREKKRVFLRNVRHGLYLLPFSVRENMGIGCPVDPSFALGGPRSKDPYSEKLALAEANGITVDDALWQKLEQVS
jgi:hypothetical protein